MNDKPVILHEGKYTEKDIEKLKGTYPIWKTVDIYTSQLNELFEIKYPFEKFLPEYKKKLSDFNSIQSKGKPDIQGTWIYFPWNGYLIHMVSQEAYTLLRTNRNKLLITEAEQKKLLNSCIGFVGLSIGSHFATGLAYSAISQTMKLAEFDTLETANLNRMRAKIQDIGTPKIILTAEQIYEINPYTRLSLFADGLTEKNLTEFVENNPKPRLIFEAIDDFKMKIALRIAAKKAKIPVIMLTNLGDSLLIDIERYDLDSNLLLFNGKIGNTPEEILQTNIGEKEKIKFAMDIVGKEHLSKRILETLSEINKSLVGRPQLYSTVTIAGGIACYLARKIILGDNLLSGRTFISFDNVFGKSNVLQ